MKNQLELHNVRVTYGDFDAVKDVSLSLASGEIGCLLGPSGCGKTTLLRAIAGFEAVTAGEVIINDRIVGSRQVQIPPEERRVGMVFQDFALFPHLSIERNIGFGLSHLSAARRTKRVAALLSLVGLPGSGSAFPHELSGGQQQRVALARAMAPQPDVLLLDEPFSNLDRELREQLASEIGQILRHNNITALLVTHDQHEAFAMADRITVLNAGRVAQTDTAQGLYQKPASEFVASFIGSGTLLEITLNERGQLPYGLGNLEVIPAHSPGQSLRLLIRPNDIVYNPASEALFEIVQKTFRGAHYLYQLRMPGGQLIPCITPSHVEFSVGEKLPVTFNPHDNAVFEDAG